MPRKTPIPENEKQIGARLREIREALCLTGTAFAAKHNINSGNLSKYENGWVPLPWAVGEAICCAEHLSQRWLATGALPKSPHFFIPEDIEPLIPRRGLFSAVYKDYLEPRISRLEKEWKQNKRSSKKDPYGFLGEFDGISARDFYLLPCFKYEVEAWFRTLPVEERFGLLQHLEKQMEAYLEMHKDALPGVDIRLETLRIIDAFFKQPLDQMEKR